MLECWELSQDSKIPTFQYPLWRYRLVARTQDSHSWNRSSILRSATIVKIKHFHNFKEFVLLYYKLFFVFYISENGFFFLPMMNLPILINIMIGVRNTNITCCNHQASAGRDHTKKNRMSIRMVDEYIKISP